MLLASVAGLGIDSATDSPVVLLKEVDGDRVLPIWIGYPEASAIALELAGLSFERPLTHDLVREIMEGLKAEVIKIEINDLIDNVFYAELFLQSGNVVAKIDARPSDSIVMALKFNAPIFVEEKLMARLPEDGSEDDLAKRIRWIKPEDFGNFIL